MAQKANPNAIRVGYNQIWNNYFFLADKKEQIAWIKKTKLIRDYLYSLFPDISHLRTELSQGNLFIYLYIPEINLVLGENQEKLKKITKKINSLIDDNRVNLHLNLLEVKKVYNCAQSIANLITGPIKKRSPFRLVLRNILSKISLEKATEGAKIEIKGRLDESDNAQTKKTLHKQMPLSTIDSNAEFGRQEVVTSYGKIGVKVWVYKGKIWQKQIVRPRNNISNS